MGVVIILFLCRDPVPQTMWTNDDQTWSRIHNIMVIWCHVNSSWPS